jgi:hypothetical protein
MQLVIISNIAREDTYACDVETHQQHMLLVPDMLYGSRATKYYMKMSYCNIFVNDIISTVRY